MLLRVRAPVQGARPRTAARARQNMLVPRKFPCLLFRNFRRRRETGPTAARGRGATQWSPQCRLGSQYKSPAPRKSKSPCLCRKVLRPKTPSCSTVQGNVGWDRKARVCTRRLGLLLPGAGPQPQEQSRRVPRSNLGHGPRTAGHGRPGIAQDAQDSHGSDAGHARRGLWSTAARLQASTTRCRTPSF